MNSLFNKFKNLRNDSGDNTLRFLKDKCADVSNKEYLAQPIEIRKKEAINKANKEVEKRRFEFYSEDEIAQSILLNGKTLNAIIMGSENAESAHGKYLAYLKKEIVDAKENIRNLKNDEKYYRRDFLDKYPQEPMFSSFWKNRDNLILLALWTGIFSVLIPTIITIYYLPIEGNKKSVFSITSVVIIVTLALYILQNFA